MPPRTYYNEVDPYAAQWIRNLIAGGHIMPGDVDERSIVDVRPSDLAGYARCHFFAGIGVWDYALGLAGWPADRPVWTGSCPCQPFSAAGRRAGFDDERHLWPVWFDLIRQCRPAIVLGEQVEAAVRLGWLDAVLSDLEGEGYACGATVFGAHSVGAPHIRQRLWFVAHAGRERRDGEPSCLWWPEASGRYAPDYTEAAGRSEAGVMAESASGGPSWREGAARFAGRSSAETGGATGVVGDAPSREQRRWPPEAGLRREVEVGRPSPWRDPDWLPCRDGKARPVEPGTFPLAHGAPARVGRLRAYGNAVNAEAAAAFIGACLTASPTNTDPDPAPCEEQL